MRAITDWRFYNPRSNEGCFRYVLVTIETLFDPENDSIRDMIETYTESTRKRFEISKDPISQARFEVIRDFTRVLREGLPEFDFSFTLFGSLAKGRPLNEETSDTVDIDLAIFYQRDGFDKFSDDSEIERRLGQMFGGYYSSDRVGEFNLNKALNKTLLSIFHEKKAAHVESYKQLHHIVCIPLGLGVSEMGFARQQYGYSYRNIDLLMMCGLDLGGHNKRHVQDFLKTFDEKNTTKSILPWRRKQVRDAKWQGLHNHLLHKERQQPVPEDIADQFPATFEEACKRYNVKFHE
jgi:hypothetical protein